MREIPNNTKIFVGLSGGVDSAVSAARLQEQGYEVHGIFMKNWTGDEFGIQADCPWEEDQAAAESVAKHLNIPFRSYNFEKEYREQVVEYFFNEFEAGRTPNPDVMCNTKIKFDVFLKRAITDGADMIATGHYAQIHKSENSGVLELHKGADPKKDQTYFLHTLNQEQLNKAVFPIGHLQKSSVRELAEKYGLPNAKRKDSQGICFIGEIDVQEYLRSHISTKPGKIVNYDTGEELGDHDGVYFYTIGQRKGMGLGGPGAPYYVVDKDIQKNELIVVRGNYHPALAKKSVDLESIHWIDGSDSPDLPKAGEDIQAAIRYQQKPQPAKVYPTELKIEFAEPQRAITSGQSAVLYQGTKCLGGGVID